ncbi:MAG: phosphorylcholine transferase LicD [Candidatus Tyloplasma litorale]|nr:MAG: phosphorylcholine transferase LicD [Mycoplasmatales bacterium]
MKKISFEEYQKKLIDVYDKVNEKFEKLNIIWWANSGTLLGAIREQNIIQWDDDIDMSMIGFDFFQNLNKINKVCSELNLELFNPNKRKGLDIARIFSKEKYIVEYNGQEYITAIFIDIMLALESKKMTKIKRNTWWIFNRYVWIYGNFYRILPYYGWVNGKAKKINWFTNFLVFLSKLILFIPTFWMPYLQNWYIKRKSKNGKYYSLFYNYNNKGIQYQRNMFNNKIKFANTYVRVPDNYEKELQIWFGKNYLTKPSKEKRIPHNLILTPNKKNINYKIKPFLIK